MSSNFGASPSQVNTPFYIPEGFFSDIDNAETWHAVVLVLCDAMDLPGEFNYAKCSLCC